MSSTASNRSSTYELLTHRLKTSLLSRTSDRAARPAPVLSENVKACVTEIKRAYGTKNDFDSDRANVERAISSSRPAPKPGSEKEATALRLYVGKRFRDLRKAAFG